MQSVNIYLETNIKGLKQTEGYISYVLEYKCSNGTIVTREEFIKLYNATANQAYLKACILAIQRLNKPCKVNIYCGSSYLVNAVNKQWLSEWEKNNWKNAKGADIKNMEQWQQLYKEWIKHSVEFILVDKHEYSHWQQEEIKKREEKEKNEEN